MIEIARLRLAEVVQGPQIEIEIEIARVRLAQVGDY